MRRIAIILNAMTQLLGALLCVTLNSNESTSGAALRRSPKFWRKAINAIFFWQDDHCLQAAAMKSTTAGHYCWNMGSLSSRPRSRWNKR
jgi:hypothetical protein